MSDGTSIRNVVPEQFQSLLDTPRESSGTCSLDTTRICSILLTAARIWWMGGRPNVSRYPTREYNFASLFFPYLTLRQLEGAHVYSWKWGSRLYALRASSYELCFSSRLAAVFDMEIKYAKDVEVIRHFTTTSVSNDQGVSEAYFYCTQLRWRLHPCHSSTIIWFREYQRCATAHIASIMFACWICRDTRHSRRISRVLYATRGDSEERRWRRRQRIRYTAVLYMLPSAYFADDFSASEFEQSHVAELEFPEVCLHLFFALSYFLMLCRIRGPLTPLTRSKKPLRCYGLLHTRKAKRYLCPQKTTLTWTRCSSTCQGERGSTPITLERLMILMYPTLSSHGSS